MTTRLLSLALALLTATAGLLAGSAPPQANPSAENNLPVPLTKQITTHYRLGASVIVQTEPTSGLLVAGVEANSPTRNMTRIDAPNIRGTMEAGDVITHVNGVQIQTLNDYYDAMDKSDGKVVLTIQDVESNPNPRLRKSYEWQVKPIQIRGPVARVPEAKATRKAHVRLIGLTDDAGLGKSIQADLDRLKDLIEKQIPADRLDLKVLSGKECNARNVIEHIGALRTKSNETDSLFVYYLGHGAFDPQFGAGDPSNGQFFQMPGTDLLRRQLYETMMTVPARFHGLVSDTCNVKDEARIYMIPFQVATLQMVMTTDRPSNVEQLLLYHSGQLDLSSTSHGQYGWATQAKGMYFSIKFVQTMPDYSDWNALVRAAGQRANKFFQEQRDYFKDMKPTGDLATPANLLNWQRMQEQKEMVPAVYRMALSKDVTVEKRPRMQLVLPKLVLSPQP